MSLVSLLIITIIKHPLGPLVDIGLPYSVPFESVLCCLNPTLGQSFNVVCPACWWSFSPRSRTPFKQSFCQLCIPHRCDKFHLSFSTTLIIFSSYVIPQCSTQHRPLLSLRKKRFGAVCYNRKHTLIKLLSFQVDGNITVKMS